MINQIIKDWVGEGLQSDSHIGISGLHSADMEMAHNQALQDLTSRIPQLTERIEKEIQQRLKDSWNKSIDENLPWDLGDALVATLSPER